MNFQETKSKALSVIHQLREIANASVRNVLKDADGKFQKDLIILEEQINSMRFIVGVVGVFNVGKSTFLNALLHRELLGTRVLPETAAITSLSYGEEDKATVSYWTAEEWEAIEAQGKAEDQGNKPSKITKMVKEIKSALGGKFNELITRSGEKTENIPLTDLEKYTSANVEGGYAKLVREVEITTNLEFCKDNIQIVDTPGLNDSVQFREHVTVDKFLPRCDMLLLLLPAKQSFTQFDNDFLEKQLKKGQLHKLFVIVNQIDLLRSNENVQEIIDFTRTKLAETLGEWEGETATNLVDQLEIFPISAYESFLNRIGQPAKWADEQSGVPAFEVRLRQFLFQGERAQTEKKIWQIRLIFFVENQLTQISEHLTNLDKPIAELEKYIEGVEKEYTVVQLHFQKAMMECNGIIMEFDRQYDAQARLVETKIRELVNPIQEAAFKKLEDFLDSHNFVGAMKEIDKWSKEELATFLNTSISSGVDNIMSDTQERIKQLLIGVVHEVEASFQRMVENVRLSLPVPISGSDWAGLAGRAMVALSAGLGANIIVGTIFVHLTTTVASATTLFFLANPIGLAIIGAIGLVTFFLGGGIVKSRIRERLKATLPQSLSEKLSEIAIHQHNILLDYKPSLVGELRGKVETPLNEARNEMQQRQTNLNQLLNDKKSQEIDVQKQREALIAEKVQFEKILLEIKAMV